MEQEVTDLVTGVTQSPCSPPCNTTARLVHTIQRWGQASVRAYFMIKPNIFLGKSPAVSVAA